MKRWLAAYAVAFFAFLHLPLLTLAVFSFNSSRFTDLGAFLAATGIAPSFATRRSRRHLEQRHHRALGHRHLHRDRHPVRLRPVEARLARCSPARCIFRW